MVDDEGVSDGDGASAAPGAGDRAALVRLAFLFTGATAAADDVVDRATERRRGRSGATAFDDEMLRQTVLDLARERRQQLATEVLQAPRPPGPALPEEMQGTWEVLWHLPERQRTALILRFYEGFTVPETAAALRCRLGTAKSLVRRGLEALGEAMPVATDVEERVAVALREVGSRASGPTVVGTHGPATDAAGEAVGGRRRWRRSAR